MVWFEFVKKITIEYWQSFCMPMLFVIALIAVLVFEKVKIKRYTYLWYTGLVLLVIYNPITWFLGRKILEPSTFEQYYLRFFSLAPILFLIAYGFTLLIDRVKGVKKLIAVLAAMALVFVCGDFLYDESWITKAENRNKVPQDVVTISDIFADAKGPVRIMAPQDIAVYLRQLDSKFSMPYARYIPKCAYELTNQDPDICQVVDYALEYEVDYVVVAKSVVNQYLNYGFDFYAWTNDYAILTPMNHPKWELTQYSQASGDQGMGYILKNTTDGTLIVIDGGDPSNEKTFRKAIKAAGGVVDAWIVTHYHQDHCSVFNAIYEKPAGILIKDVYATNLDSQYFHSVAQEWDDVETYDKFMEITKDAKNIHFVNRLDEMTFSRNLHIEFFNACDDVVYDNVEDVPNNDSLVFKVSTPARSILFCADCHSKGMAEYLIKNYGDALQADVLQLAHHGNNSIPVETGFYELVAPKTAIFDAPDWVMNDDKYTAKQLKAYLENAGIRTVDYSSTPNVFGF